MFGPKTTGSLFPARTTAPVTGLSTTQAAAFPFSVGGITASTTAAPATTSSSIFSFATAASTPFKVNTTSTTTPAFSLGGVPTTTSSTLLSTALSTTTTSLTGTTFNLGLTATSSTAGGSIFSSTPAKPQPAGLGGVDPQTSKVAAGGTTADNKAGDGKTLKQSQVPQQLVQAVDDFQKHVKEEKSVQESVARMACKPMSKVQEDVAALKQLLSVVSNGLHRNACSVEKLKQEMTQELKNAEMAQRTKDIPPGLQYENTAPTEYFQSLVESFEHQMLTYRQQIETLEGHLASLHQTNKLSPEELIGLMRKLHEAFIALAAQLHQVHEAVKTQKEHYLNYRKIFLQDSKNIFEQEKKSNSTQKRPTAQVGPSPFTGMSSAAAMAMASALTKSQQPTTAPPVAGLGGTLGTTTGFGGGGLFGGTATTTQSTGFGGFGTNPASTGFKGFGGFGTGTTTTQSSGGFFGSTAGATPSLGFGTPQVGNQSIFGSTPATGQATPAFGVATPIAGTEQPFQLNKPPGKRGKR